MQPITVRLAIRVPLLLFAITAVQLLLTLGCVEQNQVDAGCDWTENTRPEVLHHLKCESDHLALSGAPDSSALPASSSVLFLIDRRENNKVHFFDSVRWRHFTYAREKLSGFVDMSAFNSEMYFQPGRRLILGTLTHHIGPNIWTVHIAPTDKAPPEMIALAVTTVAAALGFSADLFYYPSSNALAMPGRLPPGIPVVTTKQLYEGATYLGMNLGKTIGRIKRVRLEALSDIYLSRMDIAVLDRVPNDIPAVAGLVTSEFQTPLAHVNLLAQSRGTPNMALLNAYENPDFVNSDGKWVELAVSADGFQISPSTAADAERFWAQKRPSQVQVPALDVSLKTLANVDDVDHTMVPAVGGKAANFGELRKISPALPVPAGFVIPCFAYVDFMEKNGLSARIATLIAEQSFKEDGHYRMAALQQFQKEILSLPVDPLLLTAIETQTAEIIGEGISVRLRSSANVEDLAGFSGAGLYESATWKPGDPEKTLSAALLKTWASLWSVAAFEERDFARIDHSASAMAVLVHRSFPDDIEAANGVAITDNPFDPPPNGQAAYYINVQKTAASVTNPSPGVTPESFLYYKPPAGQGEITWFSKSSLTNGEDVLSFAEITTLVAALKSIHQHFAPIYSGESPFAMDVEFKFVLPDRTLAIKQARPYTF